MIRKMCVGKESRSSPLQERVTPERTRHKWVWGWLRLSLGLVQMTFATASVVALLAIGMHRLTYLSVAIATAATLVSRGLFGGRVSP